MSTERIMKVPTGLLAAQTSAARNSEARSEAAITETATGDGTTVQSSRGAGPVREDEKEYVIEKLFGHSCTETGMQYSARWYGHSPSEDTYASAEQLPQPFADRYWRVIQKKQPGSGQPRRQ